MIKIVSEPIDTQSLLTAVRDEKCGASLLFVGTTRAVTGDAETKFLVYDCYEAMALAEMKRLVREAKQQWPVNLVAVVHRVGKVGPGEASVAIAVSGPHRKETFAAGEWLIDTLKKKVPIWKQENWADGSTQWVHPASGERTGMVDRRPE